MEGFLSYMHWLYEQSQSMHLCNTVPNGYPPISTSTGDPIAGHQVFIQKCAVCHRLDGQGRYENNTYFRPALWGPHSFNQAAGMFSDPAYLAAFVRWNMPLMAGGELTDQEAWNLEAFIHSKRANRKVQRYFYRLGNLRVSVTIERFKPENAPADDDMFKMKITLRRAGAVRIVRAVGDADC